MPRIPKKRFERYPRPLQGGARVLSYGKRAPSLVDSYQQAHDRANRMNEMRYKQILGGYDALHGRVMGGINSLGAQERADINQSYQGLSSNVNNTLINRGFGNSSLGTTMQMGVNRERGAAMARLNDQLLRERAGYDVGITTGKLGAIERRNDIGPDPNQLIQLAQGMGAARNAGYGPYGGQSFGVHPDVYQQAYAQSLAQHFGGMLPGQMRPVPLANRRAQEIRRLRYGGDAGRDRRADRARSLARIRSRLKYKRPEPIAGMGGGF